MKKLVDGEIVDLTNDEITQRLAEEAAWDNEKSSKEKLQKRQKALAEKWPDPFALMDDILNNGIEAVKIERDAVKAQHPKT